MQKLVEQCRDKAVERFEAERFEALAASELTAHQAQVQRLRLELESAGEAK